MRTGYQNMKHSYVRLLCPFLLATALVTGCSGNRSEPVETKSNSVPAATKAPDITLKVYTTTQQEFDERFTPALKKKFPNITFENISHDLGYVPGLQQLIAANSVVPDLLMFNNGSMDTLLPLNALTDLNPYIKRDTIKLNLMPGAVDDTINSYSAKGEFLVMPISHQPAVLLYNKTIFDQFGVKYPKDGMTWDEAYELSKKLSRTVGDVNYLGFDYINYIWFNNQLSLPLVDPESNKSAFNTDGWKKWIVNFQRFYQIPGSKFISNPSADGRFVKEKNIAMLATQELWRLDTLKQSEIDWDMVTLPTFQDHPEIGNQLAFFGAGIFSNSQHKDEAFQVIAYMLSDEYQQDLAKGGTVPITNNQTVIQHFGENVPDLKGKNTQALFKLKIAPRPQITPFNLQARQVMTPMINDIMNGKIDVVSGLREGDEKINKDIAAAK